MGWAIGDLGGESGEPETGIGLRVDFGGRGEDRAIGERAARGGESGLVMRFGHRSVVAEAGARGGQRVWGDAGDFRREPGDDVADGRVEFPPAIAGEGDEGGGGGDLSRGAEAEEPIGADGFTGVGVGDAVALRVDELAVDRDRAAGNADAGELGAGELVGGREVDGGEEAGRENEVDGEGQGRARA